MSYNDKIIDHNLFTETYVKKKRKRIIALSLDIANITPINKKLPRGQHGLGGKLIWNEPNVTKTSQKPAKSP